MLFKTKNRSTQALLLSLACSTTALAAPSNPNDWYSLESLSELSANFLSSFVGTLSLGPVFENAGHTQTINLGYQVDKTYTVNTNQQTLGDLELFLGLQKPLNERIQAQFGFNISGTANTKMTGNIWDDANSQFNNYLYRYEIKHTALSFKTKFLADINYTVMPWLSAGLGVGFNQAHLFNNTPTIYQAIANPNFASYTTSAFTYTLGAGLQRALTQNWSMGIGYEFADWGKSQLNQNQGLTSQSVLVLDHLYTNGVLFNISYQA